MKPAFEHTPQRPWESFHCEVVRGSGYNATWHFHPEYQITLVLKSSGYRLVGDSLAPLKPGDLVLVGANLPHVWHQDQDQDRDRSVPGVHAIIIRFLETFLGNDFLEVPEVAALRRLFRRARRGLEVTGRTRELLAGRIHRLPDLAGLARVAELLWILNTLAQSPELKPIASVDFDANISTEDQGRVQRVISRIHQRLAEPIDRAALAAEAHLSVTAFSRFFKRRIGKTMPQYVMELRIGRACRLLADPNRKVADLALDCGFQNLANFNRCFRQVTGQTPSEYRRRLERTAVG